MSPEESKWKLIKVLLFARGHGLKSLSLVSTNCFRPIAMEEISRGCANAGNIMTAHNSLYIHPIVKYGTEAQNLEHVSPFISGSLNN